MGLQCLFKSHSLADVRDHGEAEHFWISLKQGRFVKYLQANLLCGPIDAFEQLG
jgi:hypothetical protein